MPIALQYHNALYQIRVSGIGYALRGTTVTVCEDFTGKVTILYNGRALTWEIYRRGESPPPVIDSKQVNKAVDQIIRQQNKSKTREPKPDHPWRKPVICQKRKFLSGTKQEISTLG